MTVVKSLASELAVQHKVIMTYEMCDLSYVAWDVVYDVCNGWTHSV